MRYATGFVVIDGKTFNEGDIIPELESIGDTDTALANSREAGEAAPAKAGPAKEGIRTPAEGVPTEEVEEVVEKTEVTTDEPVEEVVEEPVKEEEKAPEPVKRGLFGRAV